MCVDESWNTFFAFVVWVTSFPDQSGNGTSRLLLHWATHTHTHCIEPGPPTGERGDPVPP